MLCYQGRLCVSNVNGLREKMLGESHITKHSIHLGCTFMYRDLREVFWWNGMKKDTAKCVAECANCQQVKMEYQRPGGLTQDIEIPTKKWEYMNMDFIMNLPRIRKKFDSL